MNGFDDDLREALRRRKPPDGFSRGVLARVRNLEDPLKPSPKLSLMRRWIVAASVAAVLFLTVSVSVYREHLRRVEGERAKEQVMSALRLTGSKLRNVQEHVQQRTIELPVQ